MPIAWHAAQPFASYTVFPFSGSPFAASTGPVSPSVRTNPTTCHTRWSFSDMTGGIAPVPFRTAEKIPASPRRARTPCRFGPSCPLPSNPWHPAHCAAKICLPLAMSSGVSFETGDSCAAPPGPDSAEAGLAEKRPPESKPRQSATSRRDTTTNASAAHTVRIRDHLGNPRRESCQIVMIARTTLEISA